MAAKTRHAGLTADERSEIRSTVLETRELIENDLYRQLERYGIYEDERVALEHLGHLDAYDKETRRTIDAALDRELRATEDDYERSVKNYVREATKTYLNRLVALKAIEVRGLVTETLVERPQYGNRSKMLRTVDEVAGELTDQPDGGQGSALELAYTELTDEIGVIFEDSEHTAIDLDFTVREEVIDQLNAIDESVWESDEAMGWVYQYFGEREREEIDDDIREDNYKVQDTDVATKTQLFTPRYIVEWLVDNSLGRLWLEMNGDQTNIANEDQCFYLSPMEESLIPRDVKDVRDIKILDPACGSGHMLFYAFDLLYEMYLEEGEVAEKYIPREILENNLYGIDIDPGAAQIAALSLFIKAKSEEPDVKLEQINVVSADAVLVNGEKKREVLNQTDSDLEKRVLEQVWTSFEHVREWGSLIRIEERVEEIIEEEREEIEALQEKGQARFTNDGKMTTQSSFVSSTGEESWTQVKDRLFSKVSELAEEALERNDPIEEMFVGEVEKSVRLIDIFLEDYDVVVTNPPYLYRDKMGDGLRKFLKDEYQGSADMYAAFIERATELAAPDSYVTMITMETFMFLYNYRGMRSELLNDVNFVDAIHLEHRDEGYMNIGFVIRNKQKYGNRLSRFVQLTNSDDKVESLRNVIKDSRDGIRHDTIYTANQESFKDIDRTPIIYWFGKEVLQLFTDHPNLSEVSDVMEGLGTGDDDKYIRKWWEIDQSLVDDEYFWFARSGDGDLYYESYEHLVFWKDDGNAIRNYSGSRIGNTDSYGKPGITFRNFAKYFTGRLHENGYIFSNKAHFVFTGDRDRDYPLLGYLSSSLSRFIMNGLNPGLEFKVGDGRRLPVKNGIFDRDDIRDLTKEAVEIQKSKNELKEFKPDFNPSNFLDDFWLMNYHLDIYKANILVVHGIIDNMVFEEYDTSSLTKDRIYNEVPQNSAEFPHIANAGELEGKFKFQKHIDKTNIEQEKYEDLVSDVREMSGDTIQEISGALGVSPYTVAKLRYDCNMYTNDERAETAGRLLSFFLGCTFGRWESISDIDPVTGGILCFDESFENNVLDNIREYFKLLFDNPYDEESKVEKMLNKDFVDWLKNNFFRYHHCKEYRRRGQRIPIYWHLESDDGAFSCFVYYHALDADTFPKLRGQYIDKKLDTLQNRLEAIESELESADSDRARELRSEKEEVQSEIDDITEFRDRVDALIDEGFEPDFEAGIWENIQKVDEHDLLAVPLDKL